MDLCKVKGGQEGSSCVVSGQWSKRCGFKSKLYLHQHVEEGGRKVVPFAEWPMVSEKMNVILSALHHCGFKYILGMVKVLVMTMVMVKVLMMLKEL